MEKQFLELLSPARNPEIAKAAIDCGADAVYMGYERFGARSVATNNLEDLKQVIDYAHIFGVRVYITMNTLLFDDELELAQKSVEELNSINADAIIVQDMAYLQTHNVPMQLHASTQMNVFTKEKLRFLYETGISRVVLPREFSIEQINEMHNYCPEVELEAFIHGALCCSISGQCYLSLYQTGRSGNRGVCSQSCRSRYDLINFEGKILQKDKYLLSTKDFNASLHLAEMIKAGVCSFKIEGRLKDITYVKNVTTHYNRLLNEFVANNPQYQRASAGRILSEIETDLEKTFNRGYTSFYLQGRQEQTGNIHTTKSIGKYIGEVKDCTSAGIKIQTNEILYPSDGLIAVDEEGISEGFLVNNYFKGIIQPNKEIKLRNGVKIYRNKDSEFEKKILLPSHRKLKVDVILTSNKIKAIEEGGCEVELSFSTPEQLANNTDNYYNKLKEQISKMGNTPFELNQFIYDSEEKYFFPMSFLNSLRRQVLELLEQKILSNYKTLEQKPLNFDISYPKEEVDYTENISNEQSRKFYESKGVKVKEYALEKEMKQTEICLMRSRNCIRYNLGQCLQRHKLKKDYQSDLILRDNNHQYRLKFNCKDCLMEVYS